MVSVRKVAPLLSLSLLGLALVLGGCSKKTAPEVTLPSDNPPGQTDNGSNNGNQNGGVETPVENPVPKALNDVFFDYDAFALRSDARRVIEEDANTINANPDWRVITLEGHCDERGTTEYNLALGQKRADSVRSYLVQLGVPRERLQTISYGEERPFDTGHTEAAWAQNRRVHFAR
ncbi:MAG: peptidoglycan-associated lipoprotein Pal [Candidatus Eisenbacteria bacterium]